MKGFGSTSLATAAAALMPLLGGCDNMKHQDSVRPFDASSLYSDGASARHPPAHTVARGEMAPDDPAATGKKAGVLVSDVPVPLTRALLERGRQRFDIYCAPCHGEDGYGHGIVVRLGFPAPPSYLEPWLTKAPAGHLFDVITHGIGRMYPLADRIEPRDRWAIVAYLRALQRSQRATLSELSAEERRKMPAK
jgi:mono/diheme cytochrome c family protein